MSTVDPGSRSESATHCRDRKVSVCLPPILIHAKTCFPPIPMRRPRSCLCGGASLRSRQRFCRAGTSPTTTSPASRAGRRPLPAHRWPTPPSPVRHGWSDRHPSSPSRHVGTTASGSWSAGRRGGPSPRRRHRVEVGEHLHEALGVTESRAGRHRSSPSPPLNSTPGPSPGRAGPQARRPGCSTWPDAG